ncbi:MAG: DUF4331 domain-containing protein [Verrucomicrobiota bacterium]
MKSTTRALAMTATGVFLAASGFASSHREAPLITATPKLDGTDFYMFNSYEAGRSNFVTIVANYLPLQDAYGGPNFFAMETNGVYEIHIDNNGDAQEDLTFQFHFARLSRGVALTIGPAGNQRTNEIPLIVAGPITATNNAAFNVVEQYGVKLIHGNRRSGQAADIENAVDHTTVFDKPLDYIGTKTLPDYEAYANNHIYAINIPGCATPGRMFVGQRKDPFVVNLGETFDLINFSNPLGPVDGTKDVLDDKNITSLILELPKECLTNGVSSVIAAWTTASRWEGTNLVQVSRLGQPLVNEVVIGLKDKDKFNASEPKDDGQFADYVTHPTLPAFIELLFSGAGVRAPSTFPRSDLVTVFLTGVPDLNQTTAVGEMLRLNTSTPAVPASEQNNLGVIGGDNAGFPNGRRPGDDVVDIALRVVMGKLLPADQAPSGQLPFTDGALVNAGMFGSTFPYIRLPIPGSPNEPTVEIALQSGAQVQGPYTSVPVTYDSNTQELLTPKPTDGNSFYRVKADRAGVQLKKPDDSGRPDCIGVDKP